MKSKIAMILFIAFSSAFAVAKDAKNEAILNSKMIKAIITGLSQEQDLKCRIAIEEDGNESIAYYIEQDLNKFRAGFLCDDGRTAIITGVIGDGGQTKTETFHFVYAN